MSRYLYAILSLLGGLLATTSCSNDDYLTVIPYQSTALVSVDVQQLGGADHVTLLKTWLHLNTLDKSGIDLTRKLYLFETSDGILGLCARVDNREKLRKNFENLSRSGHCLAPQRQRGLDLVTLDDVWVIGASDDAMLLIGPVTTLEQTEARSFIGRCFRQKRCVADTPLFQRLDSMSAPVAMVSHVNALPEKLMSPFVMGMTPEDREQVCIAARVSIKEKCLNIDGELFSFNASVDKRLKSTLKTYRPVRGKYVPTMAETDGAGLFMNVHGTQYLPLLQQDKQMQALLAGFNTALDIDNILRSVDGDLAIVMPTLQDDDIRLSLRAELENKRWLNDVDYWKTSCPKGSSITNCGPDFFTYRSGKTAFYFGVSDDNQFYSGESQTSALASLKTASRPLPASVQSMIKGRRMALVVNLQNADADLSSASKYLKPLMEEVKSVLICMN